MLRLILATASGRANAIVLSASGIVTEPAATPSANESDDELIPQLVRRVRRRRAAVVAALLIVPQCVLYGPSLVGLKYLLPLDILKQDYVYLPLLPEEQGFIPQNRVFSDEVVAIEHRRRFAVSEVRAGRIPLWNPYNYCGAPFLAANNTAVFSPFQLPHYLFPSPVTIAWVQLLKALVAGTGAYLFFRHALRLTWVPSATVAACYPLTGFFLFWRGYPPSFVTLWLPWLLLLVHLAVKRPRGFAPPALALVTGLTLVSGHVATAAHVLLASGLYFLWIIARRFGLRSFATGAVYVSAVAVVAAWSLGFALSAIQNVPTYEYLQTSHRVAQRAAGVDFEIPTIDWTNSVQLVMPFLFGSWDRDALYLVDLNEPEGAPSGYAGWVLVACFAPCALFHPRHRATALFFALLGLFAAAAMFGIPGIDAIFKWPPFHVLKNNRFIFATSFSLLAISAIGADALLRNARPLTYLAFPAAIVLAAVAGWLLWRGMILPADVRDGSATYARFGYGDARIPIVQSWFRYMLFAMSFFTSVAALAWLALGERHPRREVILTVAAAAILEMTYNNFGVVPQIDPEFYFPRDRVPALVQLESAPPGRIGGVYCLPANLNQVHRLPDIRGYDGTDPARLVELTAPCWDRVKAPIRQRMRFPYAVLQYLPPAQSPILDMLNLRYRVGRGVPPAATSPRPMIVELDYYVVENPRCVPRPFVPDRVEFIADREERLARLASPAYAPTQVAFVEEQLPSPLGRCRGSARIVAETPTHIEIDVDMETAGLVVLSDLWDPGWHATFNDEPTTIYRANHAVRGVAVPAGSGRLVFDYWPRSFVLGYRTTAVAALLLVAWIIALAYTRQAAKVSTGE